MKMPLIFKPFFFFLLLVNLDAYAQVKQVNSIKSAQVWSIDKANAWYKQHKWITGANFLPSTAINQLEMWQAETFDTTTIDKELSWAKDIGFNSMRVFLHSVAWKQDREAFKKRIDQYLGIADRHGIKTLFVFF